MSHLSYTIYFDFQVFKATYLSLVLAQKAANWPHSNDLSHLTISWADPYTISQFAEVRIGLLKFLAQAHRYLLISVQFLFVNAILFQFPNLVKFPLFYLNFIILNFPFIFSWFSCLIMPLTQYAYSTRCSARSTPQPSNFPSHFQGLLPCLAYVLSTPVTHCSSKILVASVLTRVSGFSSHSLIVGWSDLSTAIKNRACMIRPVVQAHKFFIGKIPVLDEVSPVLFISENEGFLWLWGVLDLPQLLPKLRSSSIFTRRPKSTNVRLVEGARSSMIRYVRAHALHAATVLGVRTVALLRPTAWRFRPSRRGLTSSCVRGSPVLDASGYFGAS